MTGRWQDSNRRNQLPPNWSSIRHQRFTIDNWTCTDCSHHDPTGATLECDHTGDPNDHRLEVLATRCHPCHVAVTQQRQAQRRALSQHPSGQRQHPGLL